MDKDEEVVRILLEVRAQLEVVYDKVNDALEELLAPEDDPDDGGEDDGEGPGVARVDAGTAGGDVFSGTGGDEGLSGGDARPDPQRQLAVVAQSLRSATTLRRRSSRRPSRSRQRPRRGRR